MPSLPPLPPPQKKKKTQRKTNDIILQCWTYYYHCFNRILGKQSTLNGGGKGRNFFLVK